MTGSASPVLLALTGELPGRLAAGEEAATSAVRAASPGVAAFVIGAEDRPLRYDPVALAAVLTVRLPGVPLLVVSDGVRDHPYNAARRLLSLDHLGGARAGVVFTAGGASAAHTVERIGVIRALWNSWPRASLVADREAGVFARTDGIRAIDHDGADYRVYGALNSPSSGQGEPVSLWWVESAEELDAATGLVDLVVVDDPGLARSWSAAPAARRPGLVAGPAADAHTSATAVLVAAGSLAELRSLVGERPAPRAPVFPDTLRAILGLPTRSVDLSANPLALGGARA